MAENPRSQGYWQASFVMCLAMFRCDLGPAGRRRLSISHHGEPAQREYVGVTNNLARPAHQHRTGAGGNSLASMT